MIGISKIQYSSHAQYATAVLKTAINSMTSFTQSVCTSCIWLPANIRMLQQILTSRCRSCRAASRCPSVRDFVGVGSAAMSAMLATAVSSESSALRFLQPHEYQIIAEGLW